MKKAEHDLIAARANSENDIPLHDNVCNQCQQSAEKYLKALLEDLGLPVPRIHDLEQIYLLLIPYRTLLRSLSRGFNFLNRFAVFVRYPGLDASKRQAVAALRWAERIRIACRAILKIPQPRSKRKKKK